MSTQKERWLFWYSQQLEHFIYQRGFTEEDLMAHLTNALTRNTTSSEAATHQDATTEEEDKGN